MNKKKDYESDSQNIQELIQTCKNINAKDPDKCISLATEALTIAQKNQDLENEAQAIRIIGISYSNLNDYDKSIFWFKKIANNEKVFFKN